VDPASVYQEVGRRLYFSQETSIATGEQGNAMTFDKDRLGYGFADDYPESYDPKDVPRLRAIVSQQVTQLGAGDPAAGARLLGILIGRRSGDRTVSQLEQRPRRDGNAALAARGEVVLGAGAYPAVRSELLDYEQRPGGDGTTVRFRRTGYSAADVDRTVDACAAAGVDAWPNYVAIMAAVGKGLGGPEPVPAPPTGPTTSLPPSGSGAPVRVAVLDTGITEQLRGDGWLTGVERTPGNVDLLDLLPAGPDGLLDYGAGHGTFVAGVVARVAPQAEIVMYRAADTDGFATDEDIADAILAAHADGAQIINVSMALRTADDSPPPAMAAAVATVLGSGADRVIVAAAGNFGDKSVVYPAALDGVYSVAGLTATLTPALWSSYGAVDFSTVAEGIRSTFVKGTESPVFDPAPDAFGADAWALWSGTSFAAPQVAGAVARISYEERVGVRTAVRTLADGGKPIVGYGQAIRILQGVG
jgi:thermitase